MAYNPTTGIITAPIGIPDLMRCFRVIVNKEVDGQVESSYTSGDLGVHIFVKEGTIIGSVTKDGHTTEYIIDLRNKINMWARFKPVWYPGLFSRITQLTGGKYVVAAAAYSNYNTNVQNMSDGNPNHYDGDHGVAPARKMIASVTGIKEQLSDMIARRWFSQGWTYACPLGGSYIAGQQAGGAPACPFRLTDFENYSEEDKTAPISLVTTEARWNLAQSGVNILFNVREANDNIRLLGIEDVGNADATDADSMNPKRTRFCLIVIGNYNNDILFYESNYIMNSEGTVEGQYSIRIEQRNVDSHVAFVTGECTFYALLKMENSSGSPTWFCLPGSSIGTLKISSADPAVLGFSIATIDGVEAVYLAPTVNNTYPVTSIARYKQYRQISEEYDGAYGMVNNNGDFVIAICFHNQTQNNATFRAGSFILEEYEGYIGIEPPTPTHIYVGSESSSLPSYNVTDDYHDSELLTISAGKYRWICLQWQGIFNTNSANPWSRTGADPSYVNRRWREVVLGLRVTTAGGEQRLTIINNVICFYYSNTPGFVLQ